MKKSNDNAASRGWIRLGSVLLVLVALAACAGVEEEDLSEEDLALMTPEEVAEYRAAEEALLVDEGEPEAAPGEADPLALSCYSTAWADDIGSQIRWRSYGRCSSNVYALGVGYTATKNGYYSAGASRVCGGTYQCYAPYRYVTDSSGTQTWCNRAFADTWNCSGCATTHWPESSRCISR
jgi:hypothetical protein